MSPRKSNLFTLGGALIALSLEAPAWAQATASAPVASSTITIVKTRPAEQALSPLTQALIQFGIGLVAIALLVVTVNLILIRVARVDPIASSRFTVMGGVLLAYGLFGVLFTTVLAKSAWMLYVILAILALVTIVAFANRKQETAR